MKKTFYCIPLDSDNPYKFICLIANYTNKDELGDVVIESSFGYSIGISYLYSLSSSQQQVFEELLSSNNIQYEHLNLEKQYKDYIKTRASNEPSDKLDSSFLCNEKIEFIAEEEIPHIICEHGTTQVLLEEEIARKDKIKIYVHSNERCGHNLPHVHAKYDDNDNYCVINLVDITVIQPPSLHNAKTKKICDIVRMHLQSARAAWNRSNSLLKFVKVDDEYILCYVKSPH